MAKRRERFRSKLPSPTVHWGGLRGRQVRAWQQLSPPQLFVGSFLMLVAAGTLGLMFLPGLYQGERLSWLDAIFTATSAVCVTGLIVVDTATYFTPAGQAFLLLLIQLGGLGMLAFTSLIITALGRRLPVRFESLMAGTRYAAPQVDARQLTLDIVRFTLTLEAIGAACLYFLFVPRLGWAGAVMPAVFHAVNAFCNAGFSTFSDSLIGYQDSPPVLLVIMILVIIGGLGFLTLEEVYLCWFRRRHKRISVHSQLVLWTSALLLLVGGMLFCLFEWNHSLEGLDLADKLHNGMFMSVTARTAGFNTVDYAVATDSSNFLTILLMTIGGAPGSTAGGMKITTFALLGLLAWSRLRGYETTVVGNRSVPDETVQRAVGLTVVAGAVIAIGVFAMAAAGQFQAVEGRFLARMFEAVSAFNTVGLSMGLTPHLSDEGRWVTILLMFLGRVGPLTLAAALVVRRPRKRTFRYAYEDVVVG